VRRNRARALGLRKHRSVAKTLMPRFRQAALEIANDYAKQLRRITVQRRLVREAPKPIAAR
jgi:hypothetical protein